MEYERAIERGIPRLIFLMHEEVEVRPQDIEKGEQATALEKLKERLKAERVTEFFKNPEDLRGLVIHSLWKLKEQIDTAGNNNTVHATGAALAASLHYVSRIPTPPDPFIAHPYTLLRVRGLVGRKQELEVLTDWITGQADLTHVRIFSIVAIGGMGKSALTWTWFNEVAPQEMKPLAGRMWWSFYESDATFENFVTRALAYVSCWSLDEVKNLPFTEREDRLLHILDQEPFLIGWDGFERVLTAYARVDAAYLRDEDTLDEETANRVAGALGLPESAGASFVGRPKLRLTNDAKVGRFLQKLVGVRASRILISTRLYPADLQGPMGHALPGCTAMFLQGLNGQDSVELWRAYGAKGSREEMLPIFETFQQHPLLIQLLAYEVAEFHEAPGDFDAWRKANPNFNPFVLRLANVQSHVLAYALRGLSAAELRTLHVIAGFRMPASMDAIRALLIRADDQDDVPDKPFGSVSELDAALTTLEDRGLLGWDRGGNRYDLHPIVRGVVWTELDDVTRMALYGTLRDHFDAIPTPNYLEIDSLDDLTPAVELYNNLINLKKYDEAAQVFQDRLDEATHFRLSASRLRVELLERLFPDGLDGATVLNPATLSSALNSLGLAYNLSGRPGAAVPRLRRAYAIDIQENDLEGGVVGLGNLSDALRLSGKLREAETCARTALTIARAEGLRLLEGASLSHIGLVLVARGALKDATEAFRRALRILRQEGVWQSEGWISTYLGEIALREGQAARATDLANRACEIAGAVRNERERIHALRIQGTAALSVKQYVKASERLDDALRRARAVSLVEEQLPALVALAEWHHQQGEDPQAMDILEEVTEIAAAGPYLLFHADALNVSSRIHLDAGRRTDALATATHAYNLAWCDGPPFAYQWGLEVAKAHLAKLGAVEFRLPPFEESQHEPMPEVEINPPDEFVGEEIDLRDELENRIDGAGPTSSGGRRNHPPAAASFIQRPTA
jgi:tetratricopeptide (TPR) repeat protein